MRRKPLWKPNKARDGFDKSTQELAIESTARIVGFGGAARGGKGLALDTPIPTPNGWTTMGDVQIGDILFDENENPCFVIAVSEINHRPCYQLTFSDGSTIVADDVHRWVTVAGEKCPAIIDTLAIANSLLNEIGGHNHYIAHKRVGKMYIVGCQKCPDVPTKCISVSSPSQMYLAGKGFIPTHNTFLMIGKALTKHRKSLILRREYPQFQGILDEFRKLVGPENVVGGNQVRFGKEKHWQIAAKLIELGHLQHPVKDWQRYQGIPHDLLAFDEVTQFPENVVRMLMTWCVATDLDPEHAAQGLPGTIAQVLMTFNPPRSAAGLWIMKFFGPWIIPNFVDASGRPINARSGEILHVAYIENKEYFYREAQVLTTHPTTKRELPEAVRTVSRTFILSTLDDNPHYLHTSYEGDLQALAHDDYMAMRYGIFTEMVAEKLGQIVRHIPWKAAQDRWKKAVAPDFPLVLGLDTSQGGEDDNCYYPCGYGGYYWEKGVLPAKAYNSDADIRKWLEEHGLRQFLISDAWRNSIAEISQCIWLEGDMRRRWGVAADEIPICLDTIGGKAFLAIWSLAFPNSIVYKFKGSEGAGVQGILRRESSEKERAKPVPNPLTGLPFISEGEAFNNKITAAYCRFGDALLHPDFPIAVPDDTETTIQVMSRVRGTNGKRTAINSKENVIDELGKSPNEADAMVMAFWFVDVVIALGLLSKKEMERL